jgi:hypothetical protein|tara:strand:+ start:2939 stop:3244 length:306 start_codon:yes stop_codon:yes gene_type:complete
MDQDKNKTNLKSFFIKLIAITLSVIIVINLTYNLILADKLEVLNKVFVLKDKENIENLKDKIRVEINKGLKKEKILNDEDARLLYKFYSKIQKELNNVKKD